MYPWQWGLWIDKHHTRGDYQERRLSFESSESENTKNAPVVKLPVSEEEIKAEIKVIEHEYELAAPVSSEKQVAIEMTP